MAGWLPVSEWVTGICQINKARFWSEVGCRLDGRGPPTFHASEWGLFVHLTPHNVWKLLQQREYSSLRLSWKCSFLCSPAHPLLSDTIVLLVSQRVPLSPFLSTVHYLSNSLSLTLYIARFAPLLSLSNKLVLSASVSLKYHAPTFLCLSPSLYFYFSNPLFFLPYLNDFLL